MIICESCKGKKALTKYQERNAKKIPGLKRVRCSGCNIVIKGKFWILPIKKLVAA